MSVNRGNCYESQALAFLIEQGLILLAKNYRSGRGELDLVMQDDDIVVCVEVKYRNSTRFGGAALSVNPKKRAMLMQTFTRYLLEQGLNPAHVAQRIDLVCINGNNLQWLKNVTL